MSYPPFFPLGDTQVYTKSDGTGNMALKITLKPHERLIIGGAVVANGDSKCSLIVENNVPVLREKDILREKDAVTPCRRIYFMIQLLYVDDKDVVEKHNIYWSL